MIPLEPAGEARPSLDGWRFLRRLVETDFSDIWLVGDLRLERIVVFKIFDPKPDENGFLAPFHVDEWRRRFIQEARMMAGFGHPHVVPVVALVRLDDGRPAMVMQSMTGSLRREIGLDIFDPAGMAELAEHERPRAVAPARARQILLDTLSALIAVHERGIVHRDVKPRNLLLSRGAGSRIKLGDFGMAKAPGEQPAARPFWIGTRDYISPEQYADASLVTDRADIYSVGIMGIRLLSGCLPDRERPAAMIDGIIPALAEPLLRAVEPDPARRPSALDLARRLAALRL